MLSEGDKVPDVELLGMDGKAISPTDFRGQKLVLYFYPRTTRPAAPPRRRPSPRSPTSSRRRAPGSSASPRTARPSHAKFIDKYGLKVRLATDESGAVCEAFGTWVEKAMYGRKYMGIDRATFLVDRDGVIAESGAR